ncbi:MAG: restriction endonuclease [Flavobacteriales bacterium]
MIPDYQSIMLPVLEELGKGGVQKYRALIEALAARYELSIDERNTLLPSGTQRAFDNRVGWATTYLKKSGLIASPKRGEFEITTLGKKILADKPSQIDNRFLKQFDSFKEFIGVAAVSSNDAVTNEASEDITPDEEMNQAEKKLRSALQSDLLSAIENMSWQFFEQLVVDLLIAMGYGGSLKDAGEALKRSGDEGIDGFIKEDRLGLDTIYIQAKKWKEGSVVGRPEIQKFYGALGGKRATKGVFITTGNFSQEAKDYASNSDKKIILVDGRELTQYMMDFNIGCKIKSTYIIREFDPGYFEE